MKNGCSVSAIGSQWNYGNCDPFVIYYPGISGRSRKM